MTEFQLTLWRDLPSLVTAREGDTVTKVPLPPRFQEAIDEAAMRLGNVSSDDYLAGWHRGEWIPAEGSAAAVADDVVTRLEAEWTTDRITAFLDHLQPAQDPA